MERKGSTERDREHKPRLCIWNTACMKAKWKKQKSRLGPNLESLKSQTRKIELYLEGNGNSPWKFAKLEKT